MTLNSKALVEFAEKNEYEITEEDANKIIEIVSNDRTLYIDKISKEEILYEIDNYIQENYFVFN